MYSPSTRSYWLLRKQSRTLLYFLHTIIVFSSKNPPICIDILIIKEYNILCRNKEMNQLYKGLEGTRRMSMYHKQTVARASIKGQAAQARRLNAQRVIAPHMLKNTVEL